MNNLLKSAAIASVALLSQLASAQPIPVPGTDNVPNEYGSTFPREIVWQKDGQEMVLIPFGEYTQGVDKPARENSAESPSRKIKLPSFYIDKFEVSNDKYSKGMRSATLPLPRPGGSPKLSDADRPACGLTYMAAAGYAAWAGKILPTEAMWEKAARGPAGSLYTTGNTPPKAGTIVCGQSAATGYPVAVFQNTGDRSGYGVFHMGGNVSEFCSDWYQRNAYEDPKTDNPTGPEVGESRVVRGGSYSDQLTDCTAVIRNAIPLNQVRDEVGFRTVWVPRPLQKAAPKVAAAPTPVPITRNDVLARLRGQISPHIIAEDLRLPPGMMAGRALRTKGTDDVTFVNLTPYRMTLTFLGLEQELVYHYLEPLPPMTYRAVKLPKEVDLYILGRAADAPNNEIMDLGYVRAESKATLVMRSELLGNVVDVEGNAIKPRNQEFEQFYSGFAPQWNEIEVFNTLKSPTLFRLEDLTRGEEKKEAAGSYTIDPGKILRISLAPTLYRFHADYPGALGESGSPLDLKIDDRAAKRLFRIEQDTQDPETVTVITEKRPKTKISVVEAKKILVPKGAK